MFYIVEYITEAYKSQKWKKIKITILIRHCGCATQPLYTLVVTRWTAPYILYSQQSAMLCIYILQTNGAISTTSVWNSLLINWTLYGIFSWNMAQLSLLKRIMKNIPAQHQSERLTFNPLSTVQALLIWIVQYLQWFNSLEKRSMARFYNKVLPSLKVRGPYGVPSVRRHQWLNLYVNLTSYYYSDTESALKSAAGNAHRAPNLQAWQTLL